MKFSIFSRNKNKSDKELVALFRNEGDMEVLGELYNRYLEMIFGVCMKYLKDQTKCEDAVMEVFEIVVKRLPNHDVEFFKSWVYRVTSNHCLDLLRKDTRNQQKKEAYENMELRRIPRLIDERDESWRWREEQISVLEDCIETLKEGQKQSVSLFYLEGKSYDELSSLMNIEWSKVRSLIQNGKRNLKNCVERKHEAAGN
jgi:RNA polymerase sigma-70 factor (ECF subfamily)